MYGPIPSQLIVDAARDRQAGLVAAAGAERLARQAGATNDPVPVRRLIDFRLTVWWTAPSRRLAILIASSVGEPA